MEDVQKRSTYRKAHGLEDENSQGLGGWTAKVDGAAERPLGVPPGQEVEVEAAVRGGDRREGPINSPNNNWEGRRPVKKWLGIW